MIKKFTRGLESLLNNKMFLNYYEKYYGSIVAKEVRLARVSSRDRVLCIGGGSVPTTAIGIAKSTDASIKVIDIDKRAVKNAQKLVSSIGLRHKIAVALENGSLVDIGGYDVVHIALQVSPKDRILENILDQAKAGTRVIVRQPRKIFRKFYSNICPSSLKNYRLRKKKGSIGRYRTMEEVLVLVKE